MHTLFSISSHNPYFPFFLSSCPFVLQSAAKFEKDFNGVPEPLPEPTIPDLSGLRIPELYLLGHDESIHVDVKQEKLEKAGNDVVVNVAASGGSKFGEQKSAVPAPAAAPPLEKEAQGQCTDDKYVDGDDDDVTFVWEELDSRDK